MDYLRITAQRDGFRRAGRTWSREPTIVPRRDLTDEQLEQLDRDPAIDVMPCGPAGAGAVPAAAEVRALSVPEARRELVAAGVRALDPDEKGHWTGDGRPAVDALEDVIGLKGVAAAERDAAWQIHQEATAADGAA